MVEQPDGFCPITTDGILTTDRRFRSKADIAA
jgi:hypothetical protein